jgi:hypothetical protein
VKLYFNRRVEIPAGVSEKKIKLIKSLAYLRQSLHIFQAVTTSLTRVLKIRIKL